MQDFSPLWSSGLGRQVFTLEITGSNPVGGTMWRIEKIEGLRAITWTAPSGERIASFPRPFWPFVWLGWHAVRKERQRKYQPE